MEGQSTLPSMWPRVMNNIDKAGWLVFVRKSDGLLGISPVAVSSMSDHRQGVRAAPESGGVLLGRRLLDCTDVAIDAVTRPQSSDSRSRFTFCRRESGHQEAVDEAWARSGGSSLYLGEWHTHPEPSPEASAVDLLGWTEKTSLKETGGEALFFIIVGTVEIAVWEGAPGCSQPARLSPRREM